jgi:sarcosine oxidase subunit beta
MSTSSKGPHRAQVVVIGGGALGAATAYFLGRSGVTDVVLVESGELASGSSGKPLGGVRAQFSDPVNIELGRRSLEFFDRFEAEVGVDIGLQKVGYLFALRTPDDVERHLASIELQRSLGVVSHLVDPARPSACAPTSTGRRCSLPCGRRPAGSPGRWRSSPA